MAARCTLGRCDTFWRPVDDVTVITNFGGPFTTRQSLHILAACSRLDSHGAFWRPVGYAANFTHFGGPLAT